MPHLVHTHTHTHPHTHTHTPHTHTPVPTPHTHTPHTHPHPHHTHTHTHTHTLLLEICAILYTTLILTEFPAIYNYTIMPSSLVHALTTHWYTCPGATLVAWSECGYECTEHAPLVQLQITRVLHVGGGIPNSISSSKLCRLPCNSIRAQSKAIIDHRTCGGEYPNACIYMQR